MEINNLSERTNEFPIGTIQQCITEIQLQLANQYPETEIESFIRIFFRYYLNLSHTQIYLKRDNEIPAGIAAKIMDDVHELIKNRPIQYILGETDFYGLTFDVTPDVLIPRPETEELVDWIIREYKEKPDFSVLDIGTGSGCIAVSLASHFPGANVRAMDNSVRALVVAQRNAVKNKVNITFFVDDILRNVTMGIKPDSLDVVVSNPPYIALSEKQKMHANVLEYEPHAALFVPDDDPLIFYRRIADFSSICLKNRGKIFFEINEAFSEEVVEILKHHHFSEIIPRKDINNKWRMISARK